MQRILIRQIANLILDFQILTVAGSKPNFAQAVQYWVNWCFYICHRYCCWRAFKQPSNTKSDLQVGGGIYYYYDMPTLTSYPNLGVCVRTFVNISNRLTVKHKKPIGRQGPSPTKRNEKLQNCTKIFSIILVLPLLVMSPTVWPQNTKTDWPIDGATYKK